MLQALVHPDVPNTAWLQPFVSDFKSRFIALLAGAFKVCMSVCVCLSCLLAQLCCLQVPGTGPQVLYVLGWAAANTPARTVADFPVVVCVAVCVTQGMSPALALSILNPKLVFSEGEASAGVQAGVLVARGDGRQLSPYDLKRLQVRLLSQKWR